MEADNVAASGLIAATKTILRRKLDTDTPYHDYFTEVSTENNRFDDRRDMHLHYRTATPKLPPGIAGLNTAARIIVFTCIENPLADPIYLIRADDVIGAIPPDKRNSFCMSQISISSIDGPLTATCNSSRVVTSAFCTAGPIGYHSTRSRIWSDNTDALHNSAIGTLSESIRKVAATSARKIVLRRGDALIVDNYRALTSRREQSFVSYRFQHVDAQQTAHSLAARLLRILPAPTGRRLTVRNVKTKGSLLELIWGPAPTALNTPGKR